MSTDVLHLIESPGCQPVEIGMFRQLSCRTCLAEAREDDGRVIVLHSAECAGARAVSDAIGEAAPLEETDAARRALADEILDEVMDDDRRLLRITGTTDLSEDERVLLREELVEIYLAGLRRGEQLVLAVARASLARVGREVTGVLAELGTWPSATDVTQSGAPDTQDARIVRRSERT